MHLHANAALSLNGRRELCRAVVEQEQTLAQAAEAAGVSVRCARKWVGRYRREGEPGLRERSSAPHRVPHRTGEQRVQAILALRRVRFTAAEIAEMLGMPLSTRQRDDRVDALRHDRSKCVRHTRTPVVSHDRNAFEAEDVEQIDRISSERDSASVSWRVRRAEPGRARSTQRRHDRAPATLMQALRDRPPAPRRVRPPVQQQDRPAVFRASLLKLDLKDRCRDEPHHVPFDQDSNASCFSANLGTAALEACLRVATF